MNNIYDPPHRMLPKILLTLRTIRHLKVSQLFYFWLRRYRSSRSVSFPGSPSLRQLRPAARPCPVKGIYIDHSTFRFLNLEVDLDQERTGFDWFATERSRLWGYNLHYFDYLRESERPAENKNQMIHSWVERNTQGTELGWEAFTTSLRIVNWIHYFRQVQTEDIPAAWLDSLFLQTLWLEKNDEKHILANHYFENLKALFFSGCFFDGDDATRWLRRALIEIPQQAREQTLDDGGHYERSPQYHCLMLENYLDIYNLCNSHPELCPNAFIEQIRTTAERGLKWLAAILFPDGNIPLFNDSAFGVAIPPAVLFDYAERLSLDVPFKGQKSLALIDRPDSGLYGCRVGMDMFIIDCGDIGPSYQPGHTHCDFLSYELMLAGQRVVVDTGVSGYEPGSLRKHVRSTKAHNTVSVDGDEQSEIWGEFRVARRARKIGAEISLNDHAVNFQGSYQGFFSVDAKIKHQRSVDISVSPDDQKFRSLVIIDRVTGTGNHSVESFVHLHPDITVQRLQNDEIGLLRDQSMIASVRLSADQEYRIEESVYCPEFGKKIPNQVLVVIARGNLPLSLRYEILIK